MQKRPPFLDALLFHPCPGAPAGTAPRSASVLLTAVVCGTTDWGHRGFGFLFLSRTVLQRPRLAACLCACDTILRADR